MSSPNFNSKQCLNGLEPHTLYLTISLRHEEVDKVPFHAALLLTGKDGNPNQQIYRRFSANNAKRAETKEAFSNADRSSSADANKAAPKKSPWYLVDVGVPYVPNQRKNLLIMYKIVRKQFTESEITEMEGFAKDVITQHGERSLDWAFDCKDCVMLFLHKCLARSKPLFVMEGNFQNKGYADNVWELIGQAYMVAHQHLANLERQYLKTHPDIKQDHLVARAKLAEKMCDLRVQRQPYFQVWFYKRESSTDSGEETDFEND